MDWSVVAAIAAIVSATIGLTALVLNLVWRRPLLTIDFSEPSQEASTGFLYRVSVSNESERIVRDVQGEVLIDGKPHAEEFPPFPPTTLHPRGSTNDAATIPHEALGDPPDLSRVAMRVSRPRLLGRKHKDVPYGERGVVLR